MGLHKKTVTFYTNKGFRHRASHRRFERRHGRSISAAIGLANVHLHQIGAHEARVRVELAHPAPAGRYNAKNRKSASHRMQVHDASMPFLASNGDTWEPNRSQRPFNF